MPMSTPPDSPALRFETPVLLRYPRRGGVELISLAEPAVRTVADDVSAAEQDFKLYLAARLELAPPHEVRRFVAGEAPTIEFVSIPVPRVDLVGGRRQEGRGTTIAVPVAVQRVGARTWATVIPFGQVVLLERGEDLVEVLSAAARRYAEAAEFDGEGWLQQLPSAHHEVRQISIELAAPRSSGKARRDEAIARKRAFELLSAVGRHHSLREAAQGPTIVGRAQELASLRALLGPGARRGVLLVGETGSGKSALARGWMGELGRSRTERFVFATSGARLIAGMSGLGQWQERVRRVIEAAQTLDAVLLFEDLRDLFGDGRRGGMDLGSMLADALDEERLRILGEITPDAHEALARRHPGFFERLQSVRVAPLSPAESEEALRTRDARRVVDLRVDPRAHAASVELATRYLFDRALPGAAIQIFEEAHAAVLVRPRRGEGRRLRAQDVYEAFSASRGMPLELLREDRALRAESLERAFSKRLIGQKEAIGRVIDVLCAVKARLQPEGKPLATLLFAGPTGVGKTEVARTVARELFGSEERLVRFDMSEYATSGSAARLFGGIDQDGLLTRAVRQEPFRVILLDEIEKAHPEVFDLLLQVAGEGRLTDSRGRTASFQNAILILTSNLGSRTRSIRGFGRASGASPETAQKAAEEVASRNVMDAVLTSFRPELVNRLDAIVPFHALGADEAEALLDLALGAIRRRSPGLALRISVAARARLVAEGMDPRYGARSLRRHLEERLLAPIAALAAGVGDETLRIEVETAEEGAPESGRESSSVILAAGFRVSRQVEPRRRGELSRDGLARVRECRREAMHLSRRSLMTQFADRRDYLRTVVNAPPTKLSGGVTVAQGTAAEIAEFGQRAPIVERFRAARAELAELEDLALVAAASPPSAIEADDTHTNGVESKEHEGTDAIAGGDELAALAIEAEASLANAGDAYVEALRYECRTPGAVVRLKEHDDGRALDAWWRGDLTFGARVAPEELPDFGAFARERGWSVQVSLNRALHQGLAKDGLFAPLSDDGEEWAPRVDVGILRTLSTHPQRGRAEVLLFVRGRDAALELAIEEGIQRFVQQGARAHLEVSVLSARAYSFDGHWGRVGGHLPGAAISPAELRAQRVGRLDSDSASDLAEAKMPHTGHWVPASRRALLMAEGDPTMVRPRVIDTLLAGDSE